MVGYEDTADIAKKKLLKLLRKKMVSFIHNGSEKATWMGHGFKTKSTKTEATFLKQQHLFCFEFQAANQ